MSSAPMMTGFPPPPESQVTLQNWRLPPFNVWGFRNVRRLLPTGPIARGTGPVRHLERDSQDLGRLTFTDGDRTVTVAQMIQDTHGDGLCMLHRGRIVFEHYANGLEADMPHIWMSVTKSFVALLVGILGSRGVLDPEGPVADILPEVRGTAWEHATVRHLLDMNADVGFTEDFIEKLPPVEELGVDFECEESEVENASGQSVTVATIKMIGTHAIPTNGGVLIPQSARAMSTSTQGGVQMIMRVPSMATYINEMVDGKFSLRMPPRASALSSSSAANDDSEYGSEDPADELARLIDPITGLPTFEVDFGEEAPETQPPGDEAPKREREDDNAEAEEPEHKRVRTLKKRK